MLMYPKSKEGAVGKSIFEWEAEKPLRQVEVEGCVWQGGGGKLTGTENWSGLR